MLPKTKLGKQMYRKLKVYAGDKHPHQAQKPVVVVSGISALREGKGVEWQRVSSTFGNRAAAKRRGRRVFLRSGKGQITVNGRTFEHYFPNEAARALWCGSRCWRPRRRTSSTS